MPLVEWTRALWFLSIGLTAVLLAQLWRQGLLHTYRVLTVYLVWDIASAVVLASIKYGTTLYGVLYLSFLPVTCLLYVLTTLELMTQVLRHYPGFAVLGRRLISVALTVGACLALLSMFSGVNYQSNAPRSTVIATTLFLLSRVVCLTVLGFVASSSVMFLWFPLPLPANATRFLIGYSICFATRTINYLLLAQKGFSYAEQASFAMMVVLTFCLLFWIVRLKREGEEPALAVTTKITVEQQQRILDQIQSINTSLIRVRRK